MEKLLNLTELGTRLAKVDSMLIALVKRRMELAQQVGLFKRRENQKIFRADVEDSRIAKIKELAVEHNLNPNFAATLLYLLIDEACKQQLIQLQDESWGTVDVQSEDEWYEQLKENLLQLTERWCDSYDNDYEKHAFATQAYLSFERAVMERQITELKSRDVVLDLGCATGRMTIPLSKHFEHAFGYDLSPHMVAVARKNAGRRSLNGRITFEEVDVEDGIPLDDASVSFAVMNLGTASDVRNIKGIVGETKRVLVPGGKFLFSFYNREALLYRWEFLPWPASLVASVNLHTNCLEVHSRNEVLSIYARPYTSEEVAAVFREAGLETSLRTYPAMSAILPNALFEDQQSIQEAIMAIDESLASSSMGAYILATGQK